MKFREMETGFYEKVVEVKARFKMGIIEMTFTVAPWHILSHSDR